MKDISSSSRRYESKNPFLVDTGAAVDNDAPTSRTDLGNSGTNGDGQAQNEIKTAGEDANYQHGKDSRGGRTFREDENCHAARFKKYEDRESEAVAGGSSATETSPVSCRNFRRPRRSRENRVSFLVLSFPIPIPTTTTSM